MTKICRTCDNFKKDEVWEELVGFCKIKGLSVSGSAICSVNGWVEKK